MPRKLTKREHLARVRDWVLFATDYNPNNIEAEYKNLKLGDVLPFPFRSGIFERMTEKQIELYASNLEKVNPARDFAAFDAVWNRAVQDAIEKHRRYNARWWRRFYFYWGNWCWPRREGLIPNWRRLSE